MEKQEALSKIEHLKDRECYSNLVCLINILFLIEEIYDKSN